MNWKKENNNFVKYSTKIGDFNLYIVGEENKYFFQVKLNKWFYGSETSYSRCYDAKRGAERFINNLISSCQKIKAEDLEEQKFEDSLNNAKSVAEYGIYSCWLNEIPLNHFVSPYEILIDSWYDSENLRDQIYDSLCKDQRYGSLILKSFHKIQR